MKSGKSYKRNLLLAATIVSLSVTMPMNVAYADQPAITPTRGDSAAYTITNGTVDNHNFTTSDGSATSYYKTNLSTLNLLNNINGSTAWLEGTQDNNNFSVVLPNNETRYFLYGYTKPDGWGDGEIQRYDINDNAAGNSTFYNNRTFNGLNSTVSGGAIYVQGNYSATTGSNLIGTMTADFINNSITNTDTSEKGLGGALHIWGPYAGIETLNSNFINNHITYGTAKSGGGALAIGEGYNGGESTVGLINGNFINNYIEAPSNNFGGAIYYEGSGYGNGEITSIGQDPVHTTKFVGNHILGTGQGGAIYAVNKIDSIYADFIGNYIAGLSDNSRGGAISLRKTSDEKTVGSITGDFIGNYITTAANNGTAYGGAIYNNNSVGSITGDFIGNYVVSELNDTYGGAVYNEGIITNLTSNFIGNYANGKNVYGGAIYNDGGTITNLSGKFIENDVYSNASGGFQTDGGAIANKNNGVIQNITGDFIRNKAHTYDTSRTSMMVSGGAIYNEGAKIGTINANFIENESQREAGAIYNNGNSSDNKGIGTVSGNFIKNRVTGEIARDTKGGAILNAGTIDSITAASFINNTVNSANGYRSYGGAIYNDGTIGYNVTTHNEWTGQDETKLTGGGILGGMYDGNTASTSGGAIYNNSSAVINIISADFENNSANANGGAVFNEGTIGIDNGYGYITDGGFIDSSFRNNSATESGGAIYNNSSDKPVLITAKTKDITFSGNKAANGASIYNTSSGGTSITADGGNVTFTNNTPTDESGYGIYSAATVNLFANDGYSIKIDDSINISNPYADITVNQGFGGYTGTVELNGKIKFNNSNQGIRVGMAGNESGTLKLGQTPANDTYNYLQTAGNFTLDLQNEHAGDNLVLKQLSGAATMKLNVDYDATANSMDKITVNGGSGTITLNAVNVMNDNASFVDGTTTEYLDGTARNNVNVISSSINSALDSGYMYVFSPTSTHGKLTVLRKIAYDGDLINAIQDDLGGTYHPTSFSLSENFTANRNFGALNTENREQFTIFGNNHTISGDNTYTGIEVANGQTLGIDNVTFSNVKIYDIQNKGTLNLTGNNTINTIADADTATGTININSGRTIFTGNTKQNTVEIKTGAQLENRGVITGAVTANITSGTDYSIINKGTMTIDGATFKNTAIVVDTPVESDAHGGALYSSGSGTLTVTDSLFEGNSSKQTGTSYSYMGKGIVGGALSSESTNVVIEDTVFKNNFTETADDFIRSYGGAAYLRGTNLSLTGSYVYDSEDPTKIVDSSTKFVGNRAGSKDSYEFGYGGALVTNFSGADNVIDEVVFKQNLSNFQGGALRNQSNLNNVSAYFDSNSVQSSIGRDNFTESGGAIHNNGTITNLTSTFVDNFALNDYVHDQYQLPSGYTPKAMGGAVYNVGTITNLNSDFIGNYADATYFSIGGALANGGTIGTISSTFKDNYVINHKQGRMYSGGIDAYANGGAIFNDGTINLIKDSVFDHNSALTTNEYNKAYGSAIYNAGTITTIQDSIFKNNTSGGVLYNFKTIDTISGSEFSNNEDTAIVNTRYRSLINEISDSTFTGNSNGAILNSYTEYRDYDPVVIKSIGGTFTGNNRTTATYRNLGGGAIQNSVTSGYNQYSKFTVATIGNWDEEQEKFVGTAITGDFENNYVTSADNNAGGGAIANFTSYKAGKAEIGDIEGKTAKGFKGNHVIVTGSGYSAMGGAIFNKMDPSTSDDDLGAKIGNITANFTENYVQAVDEALGGAIYSVDDTGIIKGNFTGNYASAKDARGGAIAGVLYLNIEDSSFYNNYTSGTTTSLGGAVYNEGTTIIKAAADDIVFRGNKANYGAGVYMGNGWGTLALYAKGGDISFENNNRTGAEGGNGTGIHSDGYLVLVAEEGQKITINDKVQVNKNMYINSGLTNLVSPVGTVEFTDRIYAAGNNSELHLDGGTLKLNAEAAKVLNTDLNTTSDKDAFEKFVSSGGTLDIQNNNIDKIKPLAASGSNISGAINLLIDVDTTADTGDSFVSDILAENVGVGSVIIKAINIMNDDAEDARIQVGLGSVSQIMELANDYVLSGGNYDITGEYDAEGHAYYLNLAAVNYDSINLAVTADDRLNKSYTLKNQGESGGETVTAALGNLVGHRLTVNGKNLFLDGDSKQGFVIGTYEEDEITKPQTLTLKNMTVKNFTTAVNNAGTLNVEGVTFTTNTTDINNTAILNLSGNNTIKTITGATGNTNINGGATWIKGGSVTQNTINLKGGDLVLDLSTSLPLTPGTITANIVGDGTVEKTGIILNSGTINGTISGTFKGNNNTALANYGTVGNITADFVNNIATVLSSNAKGGAIYNEGGTLGTISGNFTGNSATNSSGNAYGGAIYQNGGTLTISGSTFGGSEEGQGNSAITTASGKTAMGGAIYQVGGTLSVTDSKFINNTTSDPLGYSGYTSGGAIFLKDGSANYSITGTKTGTGLTATSTTEFIGNQASEGGAIDIFNTSGKIDGVVFNGNGKTTTDFGSAVLYHGGTQEIDNSVFIANNSNSTSNAVVEINNTGSLTVDNSEFINNASMYAVHSYRADMTIKNSEFSGNGLNSNEQSSVISASPYNNTTNIYDTNIKNNNANAIWFSDANGTTNTLNIIANEVGGGVEISGNSGYGILVQDRFSGTTDSSILLYAKNGDILIENNTKGAIANLYASLGINTPLPELTLNADTGHNITINDAITYTNNGLNINSNGNAGTVALNGALTLGGDTNIQGGTLKLGTSAAGSTFKTVALTNTPTLDLQNTTADTMVVDKITGDATLNIDVNSTTSVSDAIQIATTGSSGTLTVNSLSFLDDVTTPESFNINVITKGAEGDISGITLAISSALAEEYSGTPIATDYDKPYTYNSNITFDTTQFTTEKWTKTTQKQLTVTNSETAKGLKLNVSEISDVHKHDGEGHYIYDTNYDALQVLNQHEGERTLTADGAGVNTYQVGSDLGTTATGTLNVTGKSGGSNLDMNSKTGFVVSNADTTLNLTNLNITNINDTQDGGLINLTGDNSVATLNNVTVGSTTKAAIVNDKTLNLNGNTILNSSIKGTGTTYVAGTVTANKAINQNVTVQSGQLTIGASNVGGTITNNVNYLTGSGISLNAGTLNNKILTGMEDNPYYGPTPIGKTVLGGDVTIGEGGSIEQALIDLNNHTLTANANNISADIDNNANGGTLELTGGNWNYNMYNGNIVFKSGETTTDASKISYADTITNDATLLLSGSLDKAILGAGTTKVNSTLTLGSSADLSTGTLDLNNGALTLSGDSAATEYTVNSLTGSGSINIDIDYSSATPVADSIRIATGGGTGTVTVDSITPIGTVSDSFSVDILTGNTTGLTLAISETLANQYKGDEVTDITHETEAYQANIDFDKKSFDTVEYTQKSQKTLSVNGNKLDLAVVITEAKHETGRTSEDALATLNTTAGSRSMKATTAESSNAYKLTKDLGNTATGDITVEGRSSSDLGQLDMDGKTGFNIANAGTTVNLKNLNITNTKAEDGSLINITNSSSSANLEGVTVASNTSNVISSNGTLGVTNSTVNAGVNNDGTMNLNGTNQIASVEGSNGTANVQTGTTTVGSIFQKLINIVTGGKLASNGDVTATNEITNDTANGLSVANGTLTGNVTGSGSTDFKGTSAIADGSKVGQAITVVDGKLTTLADGLGGAVTNGGEVDLTGGTLKTSITGGNTIISGTNVSVDDTNGSIASAVKVETGAKLTTNASNVTGAINNGGNLDLTGGDIKNAISGDGNTTISGTVTNTTGSAIGNAVTVATTGNLTTAADKLGGAVENNGTTNGLTLTGGQLSQNVTGTGKTVIAGTDVSVKYGNSIAQDIEITSGNKLVNTNVSAIGGDVKNNGDIQLYSQDNGKLEHNITGTGTTELNRDITVAANIDNTINIKSYTDGTGTHNANVTVESGNNFGKAGQNITVDSNNSLTMQSASDIKGNLVDNGTVELQGGTISNAISGTGDVNITGNTTNNAANTVTGAVSVAENVELAIGTSGNTFNNASSVTMGNGSTLNIQNDSTTNAVMDNLVIATGDNINVKMDWLDTLNSSSSNINGSLTVTDINMATSTSSYEETSYAFTNLGSKVALSEPVTLSGVTDTTNNFVRYDNTTGNMVSFRNSLVRAVDKTGAGDVATYVMTGDETAGGQTLEGKLLVQGNGNTIITSGVKVQSSTAAPAELTLQDTNINVAGKAIEVTGNNKVIVEASAHDITLQTTDSSDVVSLNKAGTADYAQAEFKGAKTVNITGDIVSDDVNNTLTIASGTTVNHNGLLDPITLNVFGTENRTGGYDETVTYNVNAGGVVNFTNDTTLYDAGHHTAAMLNTINFNGGSVNTINGVVTDFQLANMSLTGTTNNFYADVDLANQTMDKFTVANPVTGTGTLNVAGLNLISDAANVNTTINFTTDPVLMAATSYTGGQGLTALSPIYKYNVGYDNTTGNFDFARYNSGGYDGLNPAIMAAPVAAQMGGYLTQLNSYDEAFRNMDMYMLMTAKQRQALKNKNKVASIDSGVLYDATLMRQERAEGWFRPFATFEKVPLKNGPKVENIAYGSYMGGESQMYDLGHGWDGMWGAYVGYNGSHQNYDGVSIYQNGGTLGVLGMAYKGNFFTGLTINAGASGVEASTMYGNEDFAMLMAGIASKTGYNWELFNGKFIIQPSMLMSYSFVNTFDYKNAVGVNVDSDPLHAIQLQPEIKFIGNLKNGWQPYASVAMVWNIMDDTKFKANDVSLPELSVKPYVKYGVGVRKTWGERLTGFFQTYVTNGGRNGVGLQAGFTWAFGGGKDKKTDEKKIQKSLNKTPELKKTEIVLNGKKVQ